MGSDEVHSGLAGLRVLIWFTYQAVIVGGLGAPYFLLPFTILAAILLITFLRMRTDVRTKLLALLVFLPAIWLFEGFWGGVYWLDWAHNPPIHNPDWVQYPLLVGPPFFLIAAGVFVWRLQGARLFTITYALVNFYFTLAMSFFAAMAVTGAWL